MTLVPKPTMVLRSFRVPLLLWEQAKQVADALDVNISDLLREALERVVRENRDKL